MTPLPGVPTDGLTPWNPWKTLPHLNHVYVDFYATTPEGVHGISCQASNGNIAIALDANLGQPERCWTLAHELVHIERGGGCQARPGNPIWGIQITKEEAAVNAITCDRLVPPRYTATRQPQDKSEILLAHQFANEPLQANPSKSNSANNLPGQMKQNP